MFSKQRESISDIISGNADNFTLENRVFNAICFQVIICAAFASITNIILRNPVIQTAGTIGAFVVALVLFLLSRVYKVYFFTNIIGVLVFIFVIAAVWMGSGGITGSMPYTLFILMVATIIVIPSPYKLFLILLEFSVGFIMVVFEYLKPAWVVHYHSRNQQFLDMSIFLCISLLIVTTIVHIVFQHYIREKVAKENLLAQTIRDKEKIEKAFSEIKQLQGIIPICCMCKKVRNDKGYWEHVEHYVHEHSGALFSHGLCPECLKTNNFGPEKG